MGAGAVGHRHNAPVQIEPHGGSDDGTGAHEHRHPLGPGRRHLSTGRRQLTIVDQQRLHGILRREESIDRQFAFDHENATVPLPAASAPPGR